MQPQENSQQAVQKALLIGLDTGEYDAQASLAELETLAVSAGAEVEGEEGAVHRYPHQY